MPFICRDEFKAHFDIIKDRAADGGLSLLLLVAPDVDSICAAQVLAVSAALVARRRLGC